MVPQAVSKTLTKITATVFISKPFCVCYYDISIASLEILSIVMLSNLFEEDQCHHYGLKNESKTNSDQIEHVSLDCGFYK